MTGWKKALSLLLCVSLMMGAVTYRPQKADAFAASTAAIVAGVCAVMASIGVTYWAHSPSGGEEYITQKLDEYLRTLSPTPETLQDWLGLLVGNTATVYQILSGNRMRFSADVANKILDFCRWLQGDLDIQSGGEPIFDTQMPDGYAIRDNGVTHNGSWTYRAVGGNAVELVLNNFSTIWGGTTGGLCEIYLDFPLVSGFDSVDVTMSNASPSIQYYFTWGINGNSWGIIPGSLTKTVSGITGGVATLTVEAGSSTDGRNNSFTGTVLFTFSQHADVNPDVRASITPSATVSVPQSLGEDEKLVVTPSAQVTPDMSVDEAAESIFEQVAEPEGLTAAPSDTVAGVPSVWVWLADILSGISEQLNELAHGIAEAIAGLFVPADGFVADFVQSLYATFAERVGVLTYPLAVAESFMMRFLTEPVGEPVLTWGAIQEPFSRQVLIQAGSFNLNSMLDDAQMVRVYEILQLVLKCGMALTLFDLCRKKYNAIIHGGAS